jgi:hypothetical protein
MARAFLGTVAEDAELARQGRGQRHLIVALAARLTSAEEALDVYCRRAFGSEHREDAAMDEVKRLRGLLDAAEARCCPDGGCGH